MTSSSADRDLRDDKAASLGAIPDAPPSDIAARYADLIATTEQHLRTVEGRLQESADVLVQAYEALHRARAVLVLARELPSMHLKHDQASMATVRVRHDRSTATVISARRSPRPGLAGASVC